jgi:mono/diheme cytochrome c family protein
MMFKWSLASLLVLGVALAGCGGRSADTNTSSTPAASNTGGVAAVSQYDSGPRAADTPIDESKVEQGKGLFSSKGCTACHAFGRRISCPDLAGVTHRRTVAWMQNQILHPDVMTKTDPIAHQLFATYALQMPIQGLTPDEALAVIEFFKHTDHEAGESKTK